MRNQITDHPANLSQCPTPISPLDQNRAYTVGDLHGNTMKLIYFLILHNAITLSEGQYNELCRLYTELDREDSPNPQHTRECIQAFETILDEIQFNNNQNLFRFIGDTLADRGANDYLTLLVLKKLKINGIAYEINLSNHDLEHVAWQENPQYQSDLGGQVRSLTNMVRCINDGILTRKQVSALYRVAVAPFLRLHSIDQFGLGRYSHAPTLIQSVLSAAEVFRIRIDFRPEDVTVKQLRQLITKINRRLVRHAKSNTLTVERGIADILAIRNRYTDAEKRAICIPEAAMFIPVAQPIIHAIWSRYFLEVDYRASEAIERQLGLVNIHGHTGPRGACVARVTDRSRDQGEAVCVVELQSSHCNLDTDLGKRRETNQGSLAVYEATYMPAMNSTKQWGAAAIGFVGASGAGTAVALGLAFGTTLLAAATATGIGAGVLLLAAAVCALVWLIKHCRGSRGKPRNSASLNDSVLRCGSVNSTSSKSIATVASK